MEQGMTEGDAYQVIQRASMDRGLRMAEVAQMILDGHLA
jgi:AmiR/NasT family two-component response regulator